MTKVFQNCLSGYRLIVESENGSIVGYLLNSENEIVNDVWLLNTGETPKLAPWTTSNEPPFKNSLDFVDNEKHKKYLEYIPDFSVDWFNGNSNCCNIYVGPYLLAQMDETSKPGANVLVKKSGPLALRLE